MVNREVIKLLSSKRRTSHLLHASLTVLTVGFWLPVWIFAALDNDSHNKMIDAAVAEMLDS